MKSFVKTVYLQKLIDADKEKRGTFLYSTFYTLVIYLTAIFLCYLARILAVLLLGLRYLSNPDDLMYVQTGLLAVQMFLFFKKAFTYGLSIVYWVKLFLFIDTDSIKPMYVCSSIIKLHSKFHMARIGLLLWFGIICGDVLFYVFRGNLDISNEITLSFLCVITIVGFLIVKARENYFYGYAAYKIKREENYAKTKGCADIFYAYTENVESVVKESPVFKLPESKKKKAKSEFTYLPVSSYTPNLLFCRDVAVLPVLRSEI